MEGYCGSAHDGEWSPSRDHVPRSLPPEGPDDDPLCWAEAWDPAPADAEALSEPSRRAAERVFRIDSLVGGLSVCRAVESQLHADRARSVRRIAVLLGAESADPMERLEAPSLAAAEVAAELFLPPRAARALVAECLALTEPAAAPLLAALDDARIDRERARTILSASACVPDAAVAEFIHRAIRLASAEPSPGESAVRTAVPLSVPALRRSLRRLAEEYSADALAARSRAAREHRRVEVDPCDDGMCLLTAYLPLVDGAMIDTRLQAVAQAQAADDPRTTAQKRADAFTGLLLAPVSGTMSEPRGGVRTEIVVTIPYGTVLPTPGPATPGSSATGLKLAEAPAEIQGYGLVDAETARSLAAHAATWVGAVIDPNAGVPLALGRTRYTPPPALRRYLALRDAGCTFPGCDAPHPRTEADHLREWSHGGSTGRDNLALLCPEHHRIKTLGHWKAENDVPAGTTVWTSCLGRTHVTRGTPPAPPPRPPQPPPF
ncbi:hypothetical protein J2W21_003669 [Sinomonas atrocyanea]|uniref:HNH endonuclease signature motif containing protein n=1 Tax=Sinomonas atrocyanea TaxID=37927 RepID=UPI00278062A1|nr:HNH endonuclease signature motif containing protein [Sinomonas atrocyanea]MDP9886144.1 hypothetical protein [Sinomonas atrocyanea]